MADLSKTAETIVAEMDAYEARFGKYVAERGPFGMMGLQFGIQGFPIYFEDDPKMSPEVNADHRRWFKRMLCRALHYFVQEQSKEQAARITELESALQTLLRSCSHGGQPIQPGDPMAADPGATCAANFRAAIRAANVLWGNEAGGG